MSGPAVFYKEKEMNTWKHRIEIGAEYTNTEGSYIEVRQPNNAEWKVIFRVQKVAQKGTEDADAFCDAMVDFCGLLKTVIIDHNLFDGDKKMSAKEIADYINSDMQLTYHVLGEYFNALPLTKANGGK